MTKPRRWSERLEGQRSGAELAARDAATLIEEAEALNARAMTVMLNNPALAERLLAQSIAKMAQAAARQERIIRLMLEARQGLSD